MRFCQHLDEVPGDDLVGVFLDLARGEPGFVTAKRMLLFGGKITHRAIRKFDDFVGGDAEFESEFALDHAESDIAAVIDGGIGAEGRIGDFRGDLADLFKGLARWTALFEVDVVDLSRCSVREGAYESRVSRTS